MPIANKTAPKPAPKGAATKPVQASAQSKVGGAPLNGKPALVMVETTLLENGTIKGEPVTASEIEIKSFVGPTANVGVGVQYTRNLGNFESVKVNVMINSPCYPEEVEHMFAQVLDKAKGKLEEAIETLQIAPSETTGEEVVEGESGEVAEETGETAEGDGEIDIEWLKAADEDALKSVANDNDTLGVNPDDYAEVEDLRQVMIQAILGEEALQAYLGEQGGGEEAAEEGGEEAQGYTEEELKGATAKELQGIFETWELGAYPKGPPNVARNAAIKKILAAQAGT